MPLDLSLSLSSTTLVASSIISFWEEEKDLSTARWIDDFISLLLLLLLLLLDDSLSDIFWHDKISFKVNVTAVKPNRCSNIYLQIRLYNYISSNWILSTRYIFLTHTTVHVSSYNRQESNYQLLCVLTVSNLSLLRSTNYGFIHLFQYLVLLLHSQLLLFFYLFFQHVFLVLHLIPTYSFLQPWFDHITFIYSTQMIIFLAVIYELVFCNLSTLRSSGLLVHY